MSWVKIPKCIVFLCCFRMVMPGLKNVLDRSRKWLCYREHILKSPYFIVLEVQSERERVRVKGVAWQEGARHF